MFSVDCYLKNFLQSTATHGDLTGSAKLLVPGRVTASTFISQRALSVPINPESVKGSPDIVQISVKSNSCGTIVLDENSERVWNNEIHWVRLLRLANDCHSYNIQLKLQPQRSSIKDKCKPKLVLQTVKNIEAGQELILWFSEDVLSMMQMSFLNLNNIQGQKKYVCTYCSVLYESPNPLKLHITLDCGRQPISTLWEKFSRTLFVSETMEENSESIQSFCFKLTPPLLHKQKIALDLTTTPLHQAVRPCSQPIKTEEEITNDQIKGLYRPFSEPSATCESAFKPFQKDSFSARTIDFISYYSFSNLETFAPATEQGYQDEAHIESLMSSLGKSKDGHVCIYCGKCYSRKYGLKIHIRTHTGYKPLKCKYCLRPFGDPSNLNKHVRLHSEGETPYRCEICNKVLVRRRDLERHLNSRHMNEINAISSTVSESHTANVSSDEEIPNIASSS